MNIEVAAVTQRSKRGKSSAADELTRDYLDRSRRLNPTETLVFESETLLLAASERSAGQSGRPAATLWLLDSRGDLLTSAQFAQAIGRLRDTSTQRLILAIGPADGWSPVALARADRTLSLGRMTLPHELARVVLIEQVYRALSILAGHPYHCGH